jgi:hypothetical protein
MKTRNFKFSLLLIIAVVFSSFSTSVFGQVPEKMSYQAVVRNASNELIVNKQIGVFVAIQKTTSGSLPMTYYQEKHVASTNANGLLTLELGGGTPSYPYHALSFSQIPWGEGSFYVKIMIDPIGGTNYTITTESQLLSVPYAMYAKKAGESATTSVIGEIKYWNGTAWITVPPTLDGNVLTLEGGVPVWKNHKTTITLPTVNTISPSNITGSSATCDGYVASDGGGEVIERGICYGTSSNPTVLGSKVICGSRMGSFTAIITGLEAGTTYYAKSYATNSIGTVYGNEEIFITISNLKIGDSYQGGIICYIFESGDPRYITGEIHGLIAAPYDQSNAIAWFGGGGGDAMAGETSTVIGSGSSNTYLIVSRQGSEGRSYAAKLCSDLVLGGYSDWYLPSKDELNLLYELCRSQIGGFSPSDYWSSSADDGHKAWVQYFVNGVQMPTTMNYEYNSVRAIRSF